MDIFRIVFIITFLFSSNIYAQSKTELENQRKEILNDIRQIEKKLSNTKKEKGIIIGDVEDINFKIKLQENLINNINNQLNIIVTDIDYNEIDCVCLWKHPKKVLGEFKNLKLIIIIIIIYESNHNT